MLPNSVIHEKLVLEHRQQLQREAERERLLTWADLRHHGRVSYLLRSIDKFFVARGSSMKPIERIDGSFADHIEEQGCEPELQEIKR